jgi:HEPN domain-containing protein
MQHDNSRLGTPEDWLKRAKSNLAIARQPRTEEIFLEDFCFELQHAAEKALKAVLLSRGIKFRLVHDLAELLTLLENNGMNLPDQIREAAELTDYSVEARYPGPFEPVTENEFKNALRVAEAVVKWAESEISSPDK